MCSTMIVQHNAPARLIATRYPLYIVIIYRLLDGPRRVGLNIPWWLTGKASDLYALIAKYVAVPGR